MYRTEIIKDKTITWLSVQASHAEDVFSFILVNKVWAHGGNSELEGNPGDGWTNTKNLQAAIDLGRKGWREGREKMIGAIEDANIIRRSLNRKMESYDVAGAYPIVPLAIAGDPLCMVNLGGESNKTKPVVKIIVNVAASGSVSAETIMQRGAAILSWVDGLESCGIRCEVDIVETGLFRKALPHKLGTIFSISAKLANEHLDIDRLSFLLCHPSVQRRIFFALYERSSVLRDALGLTEEEVNGYGSPTDIYPSELAGPHSVYFPCMLRTSPDYASPALAVSAVERMVLKCLQLSEVTDDILSMEG